jgi:GH35 family endo-1,4-beta-xylanase
VIIGKVIELYDKTAIIMTDDFAFLNVVKKPEMAVGLKVHVNESDIIEPNRLLRRYLPVGAVAACFVMVLSLALMFFNGNTSRKDIYAYVGIDINPSIELSVNYDNKIVEADALNRDAETLLKELELRGKTVVEALREVVQKSKEHGFISEEKENIVLISAACDSKVETGPKNEDIEDKMGELLNDVNKAVLDLKNSGVKAKVLKLTSEERELSKEEDVSMGRYAVYLKAKEQDVDLTVEQIKDADLLELIAKVGIDDEDIVVEDNEKKDTISPDPTASAVPEATETVSATSTPGRVEGGTVTGSAGSTPTVTKDGTTGKATDIPAKLSPGQSSPRLSESPAPTKTAAKDKESPTPRISPTPTVPLTGIPWIDKSNEKINEIRKRNVQIKIVDSNNRPIDGAYVEVTQTKHAFAFGVAITRKAMYEPNYSKFIKDYFNWAVFENESKWYSNEPNMGMVNYADADYLYEFCKSNGIKVRGHSIFWEAEEWQPLWVRGLDPFALRLAVDNRLNSAVSHFKGKFAHWDVNNEMIHGNFFKSRLGDSIWPYMFNKAREIDPDAKYFVNNNITTLKEADDCIAQVNWLRSQGVRIDGVGVHGHFGETVDRNLLQGILDKLSTLNLPIWITEYDSFTADEYKRADNLENLYRTAFSHPSVEGIIMWGFWERVHWRGREAAIVNDDWTLNEAGRRFVSLMDEWKTKANGKTDGSGSFGFRGFYGTYRVTVTIPGKGKFDYPLNLNYGSGTLQSTYRIP